MSDTATDLTTADATPPPETTAQAQGDGDPAPLQIDDDAAVDAALDQTTVPLPDGGKLVDGETAGKIAGAYRGQIRDLRKELETAKTSAARATELEQQINTLSAEVKRLGAVEQAYSAMTHVAQQATQPSQDDAEAEEYAKLLDLYTPDGKPDLDRGRRGLAIQRRLAEKAADAKVAPLHQQTVSERSVSNLSRAANTELAHPTLGKVKADAAILQSVWSRLDPSVTATPEGAQHALIQAIGLTVLQGAGQQAPAQAATQRGANGQFTTQQKTEELSAPMFTEKAGGRTTAAALQLDDKDRAFIKASGMTEKEFLDSANSAPWLRR